MYIWSPTCTIWLICSLHTLYVIGILWSPHTLYGTGIIWSPTCIYGPPTCEVSSCLIWLLWFPIPYVDFMAPSPHMYVCLLWSVFMSYDSYCSPYLIWNRYHRSPHMCYMTLMVPLYLIWNRYLMVLLTYLIMNRYHMVPHCTYGPPTCTLWLLWSPISCME